MDNNEIIDAIENARTRGQAVQSVERCADDPNCFNLVLVDRKVLGPERCAGTRDIVDRKFADAQKHLASDTGRRPVPVKFNP